MERVTRLRTCAWMITGMFASKAVHLSEIASHIPGRATGPSITRRLRRFVDNAAVHVREWYAPLAREWLAAAAASQDAVRLLVDASKVGFGHQLLMVSVAYRRRALPVAWTWIKGARGHGTSHKQAALLAYVRTWMPTDAHVVLAGDSEFGAVVLRGAPQAGSPGTTDARRAVAPLRSLVTEPGQCAWYAEARMTQLHAHPANLYAVWQPGEEDPWLLASNLPTARVAHRTYSRRMWLEEMFGDFKRHGFDPESTHLRHFQRLSRLTLLVALLYMWLVARGSQAIRAGQRHLIDRRDRRDLSIFQIGLRIIERYLVNHRRFSIRWIPYFAQTVR